MYCARSWDAGGAPDFEVWPSGPWLVWWLIVALASARGPDGPA